MCNFLGKNDVEPMDSECMESVHSVEGFESVEGVEGIESVEGVSVLFSFFFLARTIFPGTLIVLSVMRKLGVCWVYRLLTRIYQLYPHDLIRILSNLNRLS